MTKQINEEWMVELLKDNRNTQNERSSDLPELDWVTNGKAFKKDLRFKLVPANSSENKIFAYIVGTHWLNTPFGNKRFICPEQTMHLKKFGIECPICAAKRKLISKGFKEEDLCSQGKFGPVPVFDPIITSNTKVVVISSDMKNDWDKAHISILQQKGSFLTKWLATKYNESDTPDLLLWEKSNLIKFTRPTENGKWDRELSFSCFEPSAELIEKLKAENEELTLPDLWRAPTDQALLEFKQIAADMVMNYEEARALQHEDAKLAMDEDIPF